MHMHLYSPKSPFPHSLESSYWMNNLIGNLDFHAHAPLQSQIPFPSFAGINIKSDMVCNLIGNLDFHAHAPLQSPIPFPLSLCVLCIVL